MVTQELFIKSNKKELVRMTRKSVRSFMIYILVMIMIFCVNVSAGEISNNEPLVMVKTIPDVVLDDGQFVDNTIQLPIQPFGISPPSAVWDLSLDYYQSTFSFDTQIFTNYKFKNHNGTIKVDTSATFSEAIPPYETYYYDVELWTPGIFGGMVASASLTFDTAWTVTFSNLSSSTQYFIVFSQPFSHRHGTVSGNFKIYK